MRALNADGGHGPSVPPPPLAVPLSTATFRPEMESFWTEAAISLAAGAPLLVDVGLAMLHMRKDLPFDREAVDLSVCGNRRLDFVTK